MVLGIPGISQQLRMSETRSGNLDSHKQGNSSEWNGVLSWKDIHTLLREPLIFPSDIEVHIIRHAESEINAQKRITGAQDAKLTLTGREQAKNLGRKLDESYDVALTSTLQRAKETLNLAINSSNVHVSHIIEDSRLNERSLGILEGEKQHVVSEYAAGNLDYAPDQGESYREVSQRILSFLWDLANNTLETDIKKVLICSHMGPMRIMAGIFEDRDSSTDVLSFYFPNAKVLKVRWKELYLPKFLN